MGIDCGLLIKTKGEKKYYLRLFDRWYCFAHLSIGPKFELSHEGLNDNNPLVQGKYCVRTSDEITQAHGIQWAKGRISFLTTHQAALEADRVHVTYHLRWVTDFLNALESIREWDNIEALWLADDSGETYNEIVFEDQNTIIDLEVIREQLEKGNVRAPKD